MMHKRWIASWKPWAVLACAVAAVASAGPLQAAEGGVARGIGGLQPAQAGRVIVKFKADASVLSSSSRARATSSTSSSSGPQAASTLSQRLGGVALSNGRVISSRMQVMTSTALGSEALASKLASDSEVEWAVVDGRRRALTAPSDPLYPQGQTTNNLSNGQWYLRAPTSSVPASINIESAWNVTQGSSSVVVAVLDTGVRFDHPDLAGKLLTGYDFISDSDVANDGGGRDSDASDPGDWITSTENASGTFKDCGTSDSSWHGTQTAGLVGAATNNAIGMAGTAPNVMILPLRVLGKCGGYDSDIIDAMRWAAGLSVSGLANNTQPAKVINMSLGSAGSCSTAYEEAIAEVTAAGTSIVVAAGNDGLAVGTPANCAGVIAVAGLRHAGTKSGYSDLGPEVAISTPAGNCVNSTGACLYSMLSTTNAGTQGPGTNTYTDATNYAIGTSFSAPLVAGTAALMVSANANLTPDAVRSLLRSSARSFPTAAETGVAACTQPTATEQTECACTTGTCGAGMLDAGAAVSAAAAQAYSASLPVAAIGANGSYLPVGQQTSRDGSLSSTASGAGTTNYAWSISSGSSVASLTSASNASSVTVKGLTAGTATLSLTVTDPTHQTQATSTQTIVVPSEAQASISASDTTPLIGNTVTFDGSASTTDATLSIASYQWAITQGSALASWVGSTSGAQASLSVTGAGTITVQLTVTDSAGQVSTATEILTASSEGSSGGGGAAGSPIWALALLALGLMLRPARRR